ncbi:iron-containing alcohol dehydrogenase [bacterium]|nr:iron-containing alcohol dehydrogenase [bacterium]
MADEPKSDVLELRKFVAPEFVHGAGARHLLSQYVHNFSAKHVLLVSDPGVFAAGWVDPLFAALQQDGVQVTLFTDVTPNPKDYEIIAGHEVYLENECDAIVAVGGGSPMDCAKGIGILATNGGDILEYEGVDNIARPLPPMIFIPTTAGTAADVSQFAILTDVTRATKIAIISKALIPDVSLTDPETTVTMGPELTAHVGMDVLTHAVEALGSNASSPITDMHALEAARLVFTHLRTAIAEPENMIAREGMMRASLQAGLAFSNASLGLVHAMAHSLGGNKDLPHGECNAILLPLVMRFNVEAAREKYLRLADWIPGLSPSSTENATLNRVIEAVEILQRDVGANIPLSQIGVQKGDLRELAALACADPCVVTNPRSPSEADVETLFEQAL